MSEASVAARKAMKAKAERMGSSGDPHQHVDASSWTPPEAMETTAPTGPRPITRRQFRSGGKVDGIAQVRHAGRKPRKAGGSAKWADEYINRDVKSANEERPGVKHVGGMKTGGRAKKASGGGLGVLGPMAGIIPSLIASQMGDDTTKPAPYSPGAPGKKAGGRAKRAVGGGSELAALLPGGLPNQGGVPTSRFNFQNGPSMVTKAAGLKKGGRAGHGASCRCKECMGGRVERADGGKLDAEERSEIPKKEFGLPGSRKYPMPDRSHAANAKARASQMVKRGKLSKSSEEKIDAKADRVLARKDGGRAGKGKMSVNIVIAPGGQSAPPPPMATGPAGPPSMPMPRPPMPPMAGPPGMPMGAPAMPPPGLGAPPPMLPRKRGGRAYDAGAGSGEGRLEKIKRGTGWYDERR